jgi:hypothetical protein
MESQDPLSKLPMVKVCTICLHVNTQEWGKLSPGVTNEVKKEIEDVVKVIDAERRAKKSVAFGDGYCNYHTKAIYISHGINPDEAKPSDIPCLVENTPQAAALRHGYMKGLFTPEQIKQAAQVQQQDNKNLTERFKKLVGIKS